MIYFFYGENDFATARAVDDLIAKFTRENDSNAITKIDASETDTQNLIGEIVNINLFAPRRLIVIRGLASAKTAWEKLGESLPRVPDETDLIIVATKPDKRTKTYKELLKLAKTREFPILKPIELKNWLLDEARALQIKIDAEAVNELLAITSGESDPQARLATEIAKFQVLGHTVDVELVREIVEPNLATNAFEILNLAIAKQRQAVVVELKNLRESGEDANKFLGLLASQVFALAAAVHAGSGADTARDLKIHPFQLSKARDLARGLGDIVEQQRRVQKITRILAETDAKIKLARADEAWTLVEIALTRV